MKNNRFVLFIETVLVFSIILILTVSCSSVKQDVPSSAEQEIRQKLEEYGRTLKGRDIDGWLALHTEDVWKMPQNSQPTIGIENLRKRITRGMEIADTFEFKVDIKEVITFGDYGYAMGYYWKKSKMRDTNKELPEFEGKFLTVFQRQANGEWLIYRDIFSSNTPAE